MTDSGAATARTDEREGSRTLASAGALRRLLAPVRLHLVCCAVLSGLAAASGVVPYIAVAEIARLALNAGAAPPSAPLWAWVAAGCAGAGFRLLLVFASSRLGHYADARILHELRVALVRQLGSLPLGWFRTNGPSQVKRRMTNDLEDMHQLIAHALGELVGAVTAVLTALVYLASVNWGLTLVTIGALALLWISYRVAMRSMSYHMDRLIAAESRISSASVEYADGISVVKAFGTGGRILDRFNAAAHEHAAALSAWAAETRYSTAAARLLASEMALLAILGAAGIIGVHADAVSAPDVLPFLIVGLGLPTSVNPVIHGSQGLRKGRMCAHNIESLLNRPALPVPAEPQYPINNRVEFDRVTFSYDGRTAVLRDISAVCEPDTITAVVGPSGAGKSTLAALIPRFYDVTAGAVRVGEVDVREMETQTLLSAMSLVFQDVMLLRDTVAENIRLVRPDATDAEVIAAARTAQIHDIIEQLPRGYDTILGDDAQLSGGERQRLTIARAMLSRSPVVILDEATAALDPDNETAVQQALSHLVVGKTVIVIAHRLATVVDADQILVLSEGRLVEQGRHDQLVSAGGLYERMWAVQQGAAQ
ncbi:ABC transporter ATP-binding protein [Mycolicibacterium sp. S2-37]|nr:ABC transporter ATP-binding protein [Mycolicibacterium sp. S2-37]